ncbi:MAG: hypothetical protein AB1637_07630 [Elusimicrobiota bacterium]
MSLGKAAIVFIFIFSFIAAPYIFPKKEYHFVFSEKTLSPDSFPHIYDGEKKSYNFAYSFRMAPISGSSAAEISTAAIVAQMEAAASAVKNQVQNSSTQTAYGFTSASSTVSQANISLSTMSYFNPQKGRDPTLSPQDYYTIRKKQEEIERIRREREKQQRVKNKQEMPKIHLQGIVGKSAIINGEMVNEGQKYGGFKVIKVGYDYVIGSFGGKQYRFNIE